MTQGKQHATVGNRQFTKASKKQGKGNDGATKGQKAMTRRASVNP